MTWHLSMIENHQQSNEHCLQLRHHNKPTPLRSWFGPMAQHLLQQIRSCLPPAEKLKTKHNTQNFVLDKQLAQHLLIQASFFHQRCLHQYQISDDLKNKGLSHSHELCELLLFIRMSAQHPSHQTLQVWVENQLPYWVDFEAELNTLLNAKMVQKISHQDWVFYDKNPFPHDHLLDLTSLKLNDFYGPEQLLEKHQLLICQSP